MKGIDGVTDEEIVLLVEAELARRAKAAREKAKRKRRKRSCGWVAKVASSGWMFSSRDRFGRTVERSGFRTRADSEKGLLEFIAEEKRNSVLFPNSVRHIDMPAPEPVFWTPPERSFEHHWCPACGEATSVVLGGAVEWCKSDRCEWIPPRLKVARDAQPYSQHGPAMFFIGGFASAISGDPPSETRYDRTGATKNAWITGYELGRRQSDPKWSFYGSECLPNGTKRVLRDLRNDEERAELTLRRARKKSSRGPYLQCSRCMGTSKPVQWVCWFGGRWLCHRCYGPAFNEAIPRP